MEYLSKPLLLRSRCSYSADKGIQSFSQIAGFLPRDQQWAEVLESGQSTVPIILIHGDSDALIPMKRSEELEKALRNGNSLIQRINHPGAHMVPSCSHALKMRIQTFLDELL